MLIVINPPLLDFSPGIFYRDKPALIKAFLTKSTIETLDKRVVSRLAWSAVLKLYLSSVSPLVKRFRGEFSAIINLDNLR